MKIYLLIKDAFLMDSISKRTKIESGLEVVGKNSDAAQGYSEIQTCVPDAIVVDYPSNFTASQLKEAMSIVKKDMEILAVTNNQCFEELRGQGIIPFEKGNIEPLFEHIKNKIYQSTNPFASNNTNPFANNGNPFVANTKPVETNPFSTSPISSNPINQPEPINQPNTFMMNNNSNNNNYEPQTQNNSSMFVSSNRVPLKQKIIAIHCPKGGVGKTTVSSNLAVLLSTVKLQKEPLNVLLVDLDWSFGDICINLGLQASPSVMNWINDIKANPNKINYTAAEINKYLINYDSTGLKILAAPPNHSDTVEITDSISKIIIDNLKNNTNFDLIIFDCGNNTEAYTLMGLTAANTVYEVISVDTSAISDTKTVLDSFKMLHFPMDKIKLIVNKVPKTSDGITVEEIADVLNLQIAGLIPQNEEVRVQNNNGVPMVLKGTSSFSVGITNIASKILGIDLSKRKKSKENKGFFSNIFGFLKK